VPVAVNFALQFTCLAVRLLVGAVSLALRLAVRALGFTGLALSFACGIAGGLLLQLADLARAFLQFLSALAGEILHV
jgi:hypothetical protein